jgi:hypothetical protein
MTLTASNSGFRLRITAPQILSTACVAGTRNDAGSFILRNPGLRSRVVTAAILSGESTMSFGKGALLWLIGIPLPIILLLALFWR